MDLLWGLWSALPGCVQTVPRAELYCVLLISVRVAWGAEVTFVTDCLHVVKGIQEHRLTGANAGLRTHLWQQEAAGT